ncbi:hypothetical protein [Paenibacillus senegalensis]|uniref:hypothetical protein n=1 Tax=Paenibacillus senegalensis TaxID=1465766 RepID=UPI0002892617|nr:hypothetical protein [Paenibacillus senegalensis]
MNPLPNKIKHFVSISLLSLLLSSCGMLKPAPEPPAASNQNPQPRLPASHEGIGASSPLPSSPHRLPDPDSYQDAIDSKSVLANAGERYSHELPLLMGISIGDSRQKVLELYGNESVQYIMEDPVEPVRVLDYVTFKVGLDNQGFVKFISIESEELDPGLGGVRIGSSGKTIRSVIGEPDTDTQFVLSYSSNNTVLKLDMDPSEETVQSIKLFAETRIP